MIKNNHLTLTGVLIVIGSLIGANHIVFAEGTDKNPQEYGGDVAAAEKAETTIVYGPEFFARFPNAVSAADLVARIPGGGKFVSRRGGGGGNSRGFSNKQDGILINGRRLSGKGNSSGEALARISKDQVDRIELIRGSNPDIKSAGQSSVINVITKANMTSGSGSWSTTLLFSDNGVAKPGADASYSGKTGSLEYFLSAESRPDHRHMKQSDLFFDENGDETKLIDFDMMTTQQIMKFSSNLTYTLPNGDPIRLNGMFQGGVKKFTREGDQLIPDSNGVMAFDVNTLRKERYNGPRWEIGGDYETQLGDNWELKLIGLYSNKEFTKDQSEDYDYEEDDFVEDIISEYQENSTEAIGRVSLGYSGIKGHDFEIGSEIAINTLVTNLEYLTRENGVLTPVDVSNSALDVKEFRMESFVNDTWTINDKLTLEVAVNTEYSKITVAGGASTGRDLFYVKPTADLRYNIDKANQLQFTVIRRMGQLNFGDFASSVSQDDLVVGGNDELVPYKRWDISTSYERRLGDDSGSIKVKAFRNYIEDTLELIEVSPGVSGKGNVGDGNEFGVDLEASLRLDKVGMENAVLRVTGRLAKARMTDSFTGDRRAPNWFEPKRLSFVLNQDILNWGISYTLNYFVFFPRDYFDINQVIEGLGVRHQIWGSIEKRISKSLIFRIGLGPILDMNQGRDRYLYAAGVAGGIITGRELRDRRNGRRLRFTLKGTF